MSTLANRLKYFTVDWVHWLAVLLTLAGFGVSAYLMWGYTAPGATLACGGSTGCETVKNSVYANVVGIPLPVLGMIYYLTILALLMAHRWFAANGARWSGYMALAIFGISLMGVLYSAYLTYLEFFVIHAICRWCVASAVIMAAVFVLSILILNNEG